MTGTAGVGPGPGRIASPRHGFWAASNDAEDRSTSMVDASGAAR
jgi:hypothetical protein